MTGSAFGDLLDKPPYDHPVPCRCMACGALLGMETRPGGLLWKFRQHVDQGECPKGGIRDEA